MFFGCFFGHHCLNKNWKNSVSTKPAKIFPKENREIAKINHNKVAALLYA